MSATTTSTVLAVGWKDQLRGRSAGAVLYGADGRLIEYEGKRLPHPKWSRTTAHLDALLLAFQIAEASSPGPTQIQTPSRWLVDLLLSDASFDAEDHVVSLIEGARAAARRLDGAARLICAPAERLIPARDVALAALAGHVYEPPPLLDAVRVRQDGPTTEAESTLTERVEATGRLARTLRLAGAPEDAAITLLEVARDDIVVIWGRKPPGKQALAKHVRSWPRAWSRGYANDEGAA